MLDKGDNRPARLKGSRDINRDWDSVITDWHESELSQKDFCKKEGIKPSSFVYQLLKHARSQEKVRFSLVQVNGRSSEKAKEKASIEICLKSGAVIRLRENAGQQLRLVLRALGDLSC